MGAATREAHNRVQRAYYDHVDRPHIAVADTPYIRRHVEEAVRGGGFAPGAALLEVGAGLGKCTFPLLEGGFDVTANDLSPVLLDGLAAAAPRPVRTIPCDVLDLPAHVSARFDGVVGFFVLHHLFDLDATFRALRAVLRPGGRLAFCEPVAWNPLYYAQIVLSPAMSFTGEPRLTSMRPGVVLPSLARAGFVAAASRRYGYFPPAIANAAAGRRVERWMERRRWIPFPHAFQVFTAEAGA
jgi:SAM-dependent methyltransferase